MERTSYSKQTKRTNKQIKNWARTINRGLQKTTKIKKQIMK